METKRTMRMSVRRVAADMPHAAILREVMQQMHTLLEKSSDFTLQDGQKVRLVPFTTPDYNKKGQMHFGVDARLMGGTLDHIEFTITCTGWESDLKGRSGF